MGAAAWDPSTACGGGGGGGCCGLFSARCLAEAAAARYSCSGAWFAGPRGAASPTAYDGATGCGCTEWLGVAGYE